MLYVHLNILDPSEGTRLGLLAASLAMDDLDALLQGALDDFEPVTAAPACAPEEATIQTLAVGLRALLGDIGAKDFRPRMEALVQQGSPAV